MAQLSQIIGAILSDITRARAISDTYTRDLKPSYEQDPFLKFLSVPRTDIKEVTLELKFAIIKGENETSSTAKLPEAKVIIYAASHYEGASQELSEGSYDISSLTIGNDQLSSLKVPKGMKVTLYEHAGLEGRTKSFTEDTPWVGDDFNDLTSAIKVEKLLVADLETLEVEVVGSQLKGLREAAISTLSLTFNTTDA